MATDRGMGVRVGSTFPSPKSRSRLNRKQRSTAPPVEIQWSHALNRTIKRSNDRRRTKRFRRSRRALARRETAALQIVKAMMDQDWIRRGIERWKNSGERICYKKNDCWRYTSSIWIVGTVSQEQFKTLAQLYFRGSNCEIVTFSLADRHSLSEPQFWETELTHCIHHLRWFSSLEIGSILW
jgi:GTPase SAR1 family protein